MLSFLKEEKINPDLIQGVENYRKEFPALPELQSRIPVPHFHYYGKMSLHSDNPRICMPMYR